MEYPRLRTPSVTRHMIEAFGGYNHNLRIGDGEFFEMQNMSSDHYPVLSPRSKRGCYAKGIAPEGLAYKNALCYLDRNDKTGDSCHVVLGDSKLYPSVNAKPQQRQMVSMGAYVVIMPEGIWINTAADESADGSDSGKERIGQISKRWTLPAGKKATFSLCRADGTAYSADALPTAKPVNPESGDLWLDNGVLKQWSGNGDTGMWTGVTTTYVRIDAPAISDGFSQYDGVEISGLKDASLTALNGSAVIWEKGDGYIVIAGFLARQTVVQTAGLTVERNMPKMDFVIECGNRLWGCRYGENANGDFVNEIYCSKLGDFKNWSCFMGISTDSATLQLGSDGPFTGAVSYMGHPIFFKENGLHKVYISATGAHSVAETPCQGVQSGCGRSLAIAGDMLLYKSNTGIMAYDGSVPVLASAVFGTERYSNAAAGVLGSKYYISMCRSDGTYHLFVYDTQKGLWHREDGLHVTEFASGSNQLYGISGNEILVLAGAENPTEEAVEWSVQTGPMDISTPDRKYLSRLNVRMSLDPGAEAALSVQYDFSPRWEHLLTVTGSDLRTFDIPIRPKRCDHMRLRIAGRGDGKIYAFTKTVEQGSDSP